jgi:hypothetical protein
VCSSVSHFCDKIPGIPQRRKALFYLTISHVSVHHGGEDMAEQRGSHIVARKQREGDCASRLPPFPLDSTWAPSVWDRAARLRVSPGKHTHRYIQRCG